MNYIWDFQQQGKRSQLTIFLAHYSVPWCLCPPHAWTVPMKGGAEALRATYPMCWQLWLSEGSPSLHSPLTTVSSVYPQCLQLFFLECGFTVFCHSEIQFVYMPPPNFNNDIIELQFTYHTVHSFKVYISMIFSVSWNCTAITRSILENWFSLNSALRLSVCSL